MRYHFLLSHPFIQSIISWQSVGALLFFDKIRLLSFLGFLDPYHCNLHSLEIYHWTFTYQTGTIILFPEFENACLGGFRAHLQHFVFLYGLFCLSARSKQIELPFVPFPFNPSSQLETKLKRRRKLQIDVRCLSNRWASPLTMVDTVLALDAPKSPKL